MRNVQDIAEHSPMPGIEVTPLRRRHVELNRMLDAEQMVLSACNTIVGDMLGSAAQRQLAAVHCNDTSSARNAYPAFPLLYAAIGARTRRSLALFVHRKPCS
ncbi:hypothetical protein CK489_11620 [Bradyrhizobium sp. UFLA03-84]|uniref:hypothetical protein n=1 Tax=Bradyrhizobium sp. UFLA03-84 TaxID=418599 RepID=UPI000BAE5EEF|nr:hypothetical protein [Bradyrhizobium sp. UFLA03-84]PAY09075.1 hypothetical protein CK489_11620 [Bradyrhizobium sp. UFLA03-84]